MEFRYCPRCATELENKVSDGPDPDRPACPNCGFVHYENPTPTVQAWIDRDGEFLALRRGGEPKRGEWNMPGGFVEELIGIFASQYGSGDDAKPIFDVAYRCRLLGGELEVSDESTAAEWFPLAEFPKPAFEGEQKALARLREAS